MADSLALDIRAAVIAFLAGELTLPQFQEWLVAHTWDVEGHGDPTATDVTYEIKLALAEHSRGNISSRDLHQRLRDAVTATVP